MKAILIVYLLFIFHITSTCNDMVGAFCYFKIDYCRKKESLLNERVHISYKPKTSITLYLVCK